MTRRLTALASALLGLVVALAVFSSMRGAPASRLTSIGRAKPATTQPSLLRPAATHPVASADAPQANATPVVVELFTSEGCSSCPPADKLLAQLVTNQPITGAHVIALGQHVDYWNNLGWTDPFSSSGFTRRQTAYARAFGDGTYTPEMVVDGTTSFVGSDANRAYAAIQKAAETRKANVDLMQVDGTPGAPTSTVHFNVHITGLSAVKGNEKADVLLALTEDGLHSDVAKGENAGRTLPHAAVVRDFRGLGILEGDSYTAHADESLKSDWKRSNLQAVVVVQGENSHRMLGAASLRLR